MRGNLTYKKESLVYPGLYTPMPELKAWIEKFKILRKSSAAKLLVNISEEKDCFKVDITLPSVKRGNIFVQVQNNILSVAVVTKYCQEQKIKKLSQYKYDSRCLKRNIFLPENADTEFISAEYKQSELILYIPKTQNPSETDLKQIVVY